MAAAEFPGAIDEFGRTLALIEAADANIRRRFLELINDARGLQTLEEIEQLILEGRGFEALALIDDVGPGLNEAIVAAYAAAGASVAAVIRQQALPLIQFNQLNTRGVSALQESGARLIRELQAQQAQAISITLQESVRAGLAPRQIAARVRGSIGLTSVQAQWVANYRRELQSLDPRALARQLRDRRSDGVIRRAILNENPLNAVQIENLVARYEARLLTMRANAIGKTEALAAVNMGEHEMWLQAIDRGLNPALVEQEWGVLQDGRQRDSHDSMQGQLRPLGQSFISGRGAQLRFPGDPSAPAREVVSCRCVVARRFVENPL